MFHVIPVLKIPVHATYFHRAIERGRHFENRITPLKEKIPDLMQAFPLGKEID